MNWEGVRIALKRDCCVPGDWPIRPWLFVPQHEADRLVEKLAMLVGVDGPPIFRPRITALESAQPLRYQSWNHQDKETDKSAIPEAFRF